MKRSEAQKKLQTLVNRIERKTGARVYLSVISDSGKVQYVVVNSIKDGHPTAAKKEIRDWAKTNKVKLRWLNSKKPPKTKNPKHKKKSVPKKTGKPPKKRPQIPPPFKRLTDKKIDKLKKIFRVHDEEITNPDPPDCPKCGMKYKNLKTGLDFEAVRDMLWVQDDDPEFWRYKRRGSVLGLWYEIKRGMWGDHLQMCGGKPITEAQYLDYLAQAEEY